MSLDPNEIFNIDITIDTEGLEDVVNNCNLGAGTFEEPIFADSFAVVGDLIEVPIEQNAGRSVYPVKAIQFNIKEKVAGQNPTLKLLCVNLLDVTKPHTLMLDQELIDDVYDVNFDCTNLTTQGRLLCVPSNDASDCILDFNLNSPLEPAGNYNFNAFTTIFTMEISGITCCFSIDPFYRIRRRTRR